jgi:hypothetical protein
MIDTLSSCRPNGRRGTGGDDDDDDRDIRRPMMVNCRAVVQ